MGPYSVEHPQYLLSPESPPLPLQTSGSNEVMLTTICSTNEIDFFLFNVFTSFFQLSEKDFNVLSKIASKPETLYSKYERVFELYSQFRLKNQKHKSTDVRGGPNVPLYLLRKCIHLEDNDAAETILDQVADTKLTIQDLTRVADDITHLKDIQAALMGVLQLSNWKEA